MSRCAPLRAISSPLTLLDKIDPAYRAICQAQTGLLQSSAHSEALDRATAALAQLAKDLGHEGRFMTPLHSTPGPRE